MPASRPVRIALLALAVVVLLPVIAGGVLLATFDPGVYRARIEQAVRRRTGRDLVLAGRLSLHVLPLSLSARDVALANLPGRSRPAMLRADRLRADIAPLALLGGRMRITRVTLVRPDLLLETDAAGRPNWRFALKGAPDGVPAPVPASASTPQPPPVRAAAPLSVQALRVEDGTLTLRNGRTGLSETLAIPRLDASAKALQGDVAVSGRAVYAGLPFTFAGTLGPLARLADSGATTAWPFALAFSVAGADLRIEGAARRPLQARDYVLKLSADVPDLAGLAPLLPGMRLPALRALQASIEIADLGGPLPAIAGVSLHAGAADLDAYAPGLHLARLDLASPGLGQPIQLQADGAYADAPVRLEATLGPPAGLLPGAAPFPLRLSAAAAGGVLRAQGSLARPLQLSGLDLAVSARIADLAAFDPWFHRPLPALKDLTFEGGVTDAQGNIGNGLVLTGARLTTAQGDLAGNATLRFARPFGVQATLSASRIDADALQSAFAPPPASPGSAPGPAAAPSLPKLPLHALAGWDADVALRAGALTERGVTYHDVALHLLLKGSRLRVQPLSARTPGGPIDGALDIDAERVPPTASLVLHAPRLELKPLLGWFGLPEDANGALEVDADLHGAGDTSQALLAGLDGHLGLALVDGAVGNGLIEALFGDTLRAGHLPVDVLRQSGKNAVRCFAARFDAAHGEADVRALTLDTTRLRVSGSGSIDLRDRTLALHLRPLVKVAGSGIVVPLLVSGPWHAPTTRFDPTGVPGAAAGTAVELARKGSPLAPLTSALASAGEHLLGDTGEACGPALALARDGRPGPLPGPEKPPKGVDLLRGLFR
ncbi:MAG: AsmA family protein [Acidisphaera sp.]|nr:AsmA family protein [Acidisphaera sp.]